VYLRLSRGLCSSAFVAAANNPRRQVVADTVPLLVGLLVFGLAAGLLAGFVEGILDRKS
jgi:hypothetical protein